MDEGCRKTESVVWAQPHQQRLGFVAIEVTVFSFSVRLDLRLWRRQSRRGPQSPTRRSEPILSSYASLLGVLQTQLATTQLCWLFVAALISPEFMVVSLVSRCDLGVQI